MYKEYGIKMISTPEVNIFRLINRLGTRPNQDVSYEMENINTAV